MRNHVSVSRLFIFSVLLSSPSYAQWKPDFRLTEDPAESRLSLNNARSIVAYSDLVFVVWIDIRSGYKEIFSKRSVNGGITWEKDKQVTYTAVPQYPSISISGSLLHLVWEDDRNGNREIYYKRSTDKGTNWEQDHRLTNDNGSSVIPSLATTGGHLHLVWYDNRAGIATTDNEVDNYEIYYKRSLDSGRSWSLKSIPWNLTQGDKRLTENISQSVLPSVASSGSNVHVVWYDARDNNYEIYYKRSIDGGLHWEPDRRLTATSFPSVHPSVSVQGSTVHIAWEEKSYSSNSEIYYKHSMDNGSSWGDAIRLTNDTAMSLDPSIAVHDRGVHIVWSDNRDGNQEIYYKRSRDDGMTWGPDTRLTNNPGNSTNPGIALTGKAVHVVWMDNRDGNFELYYKQDPTGNTSTTR